MEIYFDWELDDMDYIMNAVGQKIDKKGSQN